MILILLLAILVILAIVIFLIGSLAISKAINGVFFGLFGNLFIVIKIFCWIKKIFLIGLIVKLLTIEKKQREWTRREKEYEEAI